MPGLAGDTRSATAVLDVPGSLQPVLAVRVRLLPSRGEASNAIRIPDYTLQNLEGRDVVVVRPNQRSRASNSTVGRRSADRVDTRPGMTTGHRLEPHLSLLPNAYTGN